VNVLVPGGPTDTPMISDQPREKMLRPEIMGPPIAWLVSDASADFNGQRITAARWDPSLPLAQAAKRASRAISWPELTADAVWYQTGHKSLEMLRVYCRDAASLSAGWPDADNSGSQGTEIGHTPKSDKKPRGARVRSSDSFVILEAMAVARHLARRKQLSTSSGRGHSATSQAIC
jgi:hypothetical protein